MVSISTISQLVDSIDYKSQLIGRNQRLESGVKATRIKGMFIGFILTIVIVGIPIIYYMG